MAELGQASGDWTESSSALRIMYVGVRNSLGIATLDAFTQTNPPIVTTPITVSTQVNTRAFGVLSGSVVFARIDQGSNFHGGPVEPGAPEGLRILPLGVAINNATGNAFENQPAVASGRVPYVSSQGTYGNRLFETQALATVGAINQGDQLVYAAGQELVASRNGYLMMRETAQTGANISLDVAAVTSQVANGQAASTTIGVLKMPPDATMFELIYDQQI